mgnify:CR=1 FL=1
MDLSSATSGQQQIITTLDAPLSVAAGAGSGKTFTLTNRIAYALIGETGEASSFIGNVDEVLAITFSRSGAAELKSRIRSLLQAEGLEDQACAVEDAWVTTIHGMCARILREHALELGIDPAFQVVEDIESEELWQQALESALQRWADEDSAPRIKRLIELFPRSKGPQGPSGIAVFLTRLWEKTLSMPDGFESIHLPEPSVDLAEALRTLIELGEEFQAISRTWTKLGRYDQGYLDALDAALDAARAYQQRIDLVSASFADERFDAQEYLELILSFPKTSEKYQAKGPDADFFASYRCTYRDIARSVMQDAAAVLSADMLELLKLVDYEYQRLKGPGRLDNTDLLRSCCDALHLDPALRASYQRRFKLIMVDEFQDTDSLQVAIIDHLSRDHGANVMTVGDAQQSIYRFRGADVEVFFRHRETQRAVHQRFQALSLPDNFRSHGDILKFVDAIFSKPSFFGDEFLSLLPKGKENQIDDPLFADRPRVKMSVIENRRGGASANDVRELTARRIAQHFSELRAAGVSPGKMVILLGSMSNVDLYARALADEGFESLVTAGSVFARMPEVNIVKALLIALADHTNSTALYQVLSSPLFDLSDAALFALGHLRFSEEEHGRASFAARFWRLLAAFEADGDRAVLQLLDPCDLAQEDLREAMRVLELFRSLLQDLSKRGVHDALHALILDAGWFYRLETAGTEGLAVAANLFKALEFVRDWEHQHRTLHQIADDFAAFLEVSKQTPGVLATPESEFVRIMTIHASKGLEFDHVAVAEIRSGLPKASPLRVEPYGDEILFSLKPVVSASAKATFDGLMGFTSDEESDQIPTCQDPSSLSPVEVSDLLDARIQRGEIDDAQRLLYVALTRAVKSLYLCLGFEGNAKFDYAKKGIFGLLHEAIDWERTAEPTTFTFDFGGSRPALVSHEVLAQGIAEEEVSAQQERTFSVVKRQRAASVAVPSVSVRDDVVSYSSIAPDHGPALEQGDTADHKISEEPFIDDLSAALKQESAVALGTAFHRLAQRAIESRRFVGAPAEVPEEALAVQAASCDLSPDQAQRLRFALDRWFGSDLCARFMACDQVRAEVPFMLEIEREDARIFLEGEIDGLAFDPNEPAKRALFIDYKTGGNDQESAACLYEKHLLQAQCYALALMRQGFDEVEAYFIRVERACPADQSQPQVVPYTFAQSDRDALEEAVMAAYRVTKR